MKTLESQNIEKQLWKLFNYLRTRPTTDESNVYWLIVIAVIAKQSPEKFKQLFELDSEKKQSFVIACNEELSRYQIETHSLESIISFIALISDFVLLADEIMKLLSGFSSRSSCFNLSSQIILAFISKSISQENLTSVYDGAAGYCFLTNQITAEHFYLVDVNTSAKALGTGLMLLKDKNFDYSLGNSLFSPISNYKADLVICEPPLNSRLSSDVISEIQKSNYILSKELEKLPTSAGNSVWIQNSLYHLNEQGKAFVILPHGWLFRGGYDALLRQFILDLDVIEAIVGLPEKSLKYTSIPPFVLVLNKNKKNKKVIHYVDASKMGHIDKHELKINDQEMQSIVDMAQGKNTDEPYYRAVSHTQIKENDNNLSISRYFIKKEEFRPCYIKDELCELGNIIKTAEVSQQKLFNLLAKELKK